MERFLWRCRAALGGGFALCGAAALAGVFLPCDAAALAGDFLPCGAAALAGGLSDSAFLYVPEQKIEGVDFVLAFVQLIHQTRPVSAQLLDGFFYLSVLI